MKPLQTFYYLSNGRFTKVTAEFMNNYEYEALEKGLNIEDVYEEGRLVVAGYKVWDNNRPTRWVPFDDFHSFHFEGSAIDYVKNIKKSVLSPEFYNDYIKQNFND